MFQLNHIQFHANFSFTKKLMFVLFAHGMCLIKVSDIDLFSFNLNIKNVFFFCRFCKEEAKFVFRGKSAN